MSLFTFFNNEPFSDFDRLFDEAFARRTAGTGTQVQRQQGNTAPHVLLPRYARIPLIPQTAHGCSHNPPRVDVHEDKDKNLVTAAFELPGVNKENVSIDVHNNLLTVSGESKFESDRDENGYVVRERRFGRFSRSLPVPEGVKVSVVL